MSNAGHNSAPSQLRSFVDRLVHLEERKREIAQDIKDVKDEAKSAGFDKRVVTQIVRETMMDEEQRTAQREFEEICEVYRASLGMLGGTPLGEAARKRAAGKRPPPPGEPGAAPDEPGADEGEADAGGPEVSPEEVMPPEDIDTARDKGREAARSGVKIFANPYIYGDPRRAAWDEAFCQEAGSDGMEVPDAWRRKPKPKKPPEAGKGDEGAAP